MEGLLQQAHLAGLGQPLGGLDGRTLRLGHRQQTRLHQYAIDDHRTGAAFTGAAAFLGAGKIEIVAQEIEQSLMRLGITCDLAAVDGRLDVEVRHMLPAVPGKARPHRHGAQH